MAHNTKIEWTHMPGFRGDTWNPTRGCRKLSAGCKHCYAETFAERWRGIPGHAYELGFDPRTVPTALDLPLRRTTPTCWFVNSMSDLFLEDFEDEFIASVFAVMGACPQHRFLVLTKRAERMRKWFEWCEQVDSEVGGNLHDAGWPFENVWMGVSVEDQATADERIPHLLATPAAVRFVSYEPALGPVDFGKGLPHDAECPACFPGRTSLDWLIVGGESGPGARPFDVSWARSAVEQCRAAGVPMFVKQLGARPRGEFGAGKVPITDQHPANRDIWVLRDRKGGDMSEWPEALRVREWPR